MLEIIKDRFKPNRLWFWLDHLKVILFSGEAFSSIMYNQAWLTSFVVFAFQPHMEARFFSSMNIHIYDEIDAYNQ